MNWNKKLYYKATPVYLVIIAYFPITASDGWLWRKLGSLQRHRGDELLKVHIQGNYSIMTEVSSVKSVLKVFIYINP